VTSPPTPGRVLRGCFVSDCADPSPRHLSPVALFVRAYRKRTGRRREEGRKRGKQHVVRLSRERTEADERAEASAAYRYAQRIATPRTFAERAIPCGFTYPDHPSFLRQSGPVEGRIISARRRITSRQIWTRATAPIIILLKLLEVSGSKREYLRKQSFSSCSSSSSSKHVLIEHVLYFIRCGCVMSTSNFRTIAHIAQYFEGRLFFAIFASWLLSISLT